MLKDCPAITSVGGLTASAGQEVLLVLGFLVVILEEPLLGGVFSSHWSMYGYSVCSDTARVILAGVILLRR
jgi:acetyl-CoA carboxylase beta subunit